MSEIIKADLSTFPNRKAEMKGYEIWTGFGANGEKQLLYLLNKDLDPNELDGDSLYKKNTVILAQIDHANIIKPFGIGRYEGKLYAIYPEWGTSLSNLPSETGLKPRELLILARHVILGLKYAFDKGIICHGNLRPEFIWLNLNEGGVKISGFGLYSAIFSSSKKPYEFMPEYWDPIALIEADVDYRQDLFALGAILLERFIKRPFPATFNSQVLKDPKLLNLALKNIEQLPMPIQEILYRMLTQNQAERYTSLESILDDINNLLGEDDGRVEFESFIFSTNLGGKYKVTKQLVSSHIWTNYQGEDITDGRPVFIKMISLRQHPSITEHFKTTFKQLVSLRHENIVSVYDVGMHFEFGYIVMELMDQKLEDILIRRSTLPLTDAAYIAFYINKALEFLHFHHLTPYGGIHPRNVFLSHDIKTIKIGDPLVSLWARHNGNLNQVSAEYANPESAANLTETIASDYYTLGVLVYEILIGHPPFTMKVEDEILSDHRYTPLTGPIADALITDEAKNFLFMCLDKKPGARFHHFKPVQEELERILGWDRKAVVEVENFFFDFAELNIIGKNVREKDEMIVSMRLPSPNQTPRAAFALMRGYSPQTGEGNELARLIHEKVRQYLLTPQVLGTHVAKLLRETPEVFCAEVMKHLNVEVYRWAFRRNKTKKAGGGLALAIIQDNTLYASFCGPVAFRVYHQGDFVDVQDDRWTVAEELEIGEVSKDFDDNIHQVLGFGEAIKINTLKRRLKEGDQIVLTSQSIVELLSVAEIKDLITSSDNPVQSIEIIQNDLVRRRLEGTLSIILINIGRVIAYGEQNISKSKKGALARNFLHQGNTYLRSGEPDNAIAQYQKALDLSPSTSIIHQKLGEAYASKGMTSLALASFLEAIDLNNKLGSAYILASNLLLNSKRRREAIDLLEQGYVKGVMDAELYALLGQLFFRERKIELAKLHLEKALEIKPEHPTASYYLGLVTKAEAGLFNRIKKMLNRPVTKSNTDSDL